MTAAALLAPVDHRPWPAPERPWSVAMRWHDLAFLHWPLPPARVQALLPPGLELDLFDGQAWLGVVPFRMSGVRLHGLPALPGAGAFPEINLRTYVRRGDRAGVWFFSLDAASALAVLAARRWFHLPYHKARMRCDARGERIEYASARLGPVQAAFASRYGPSGPIMRAEAGSLAHFVSERYALYAWNERKRRLLFGEIHHAPWPLQPCEVEIDHQSLERPFELRLPSSPPVAWFARELDVVAWSARAV